MTVVGALHHHQQQQVVGAPPSEISHSYIEDDGSSEVSSMFLSSSDWIFEDDNKEEVVSSSMKESTFLTSASSSYVKLEQQQQHTSTTDDETNSLFSTDDDDDHHHEDNESDNDSSSTRSDNSITTGRTAQRHHDYQQILSNKAQQVVLDARNVVHSVADETQRSVVSLSSEASEQARQAALLASHLLTSITSSKAQHYNASKNTRTTFKEGCVARRRVAVNPTIVIQRPMDPAATTTTAKSSFSCSKKHKYYSQTAAKQLDDSQQDCDSGMMEALYAPRKIQEPLPAEEHQDNNNNNSSPMCDDLVVEFCTEIGDQARLAVQMITSLFEKSSSKDTGEEPLNNNNQGDIEFMQEDIVILPPLSPQDVEIPTVVRKGHVLPELLLLEKNVFHLERHTATSTNSHDDDVFDFADADSAFDSSSFPIVKRVTFDESTFAEWV